MGTYKMIQLYMLHDINLITVIQSILTCYTMPPHGDEVLYDDRALTSKSHLSRGKNTVKWDHTSKAFLLPFSSWNDNGDYYMASTNAFLSRIWSIWRIRRIMIVEDWKLVNWNIYFKFHGKCKWPESFSYCFINVSTEILFLNTYQGT